MIRCIVPAPAAALPLELADPGLDPKKFEATSVFEDDDEGTGGWDCVCAFFFTVELGIGMRRFRGRSESSTSIPSARGSGASEISRRGDRA